MNNDNNKKNNLGDSTRSFTNTEKLRFLGNDNGEIKVNTEVNIKKAKAKKVIKKSTKVTLFSAKKIFQWTFNILLTILLIGLICGIIVGITFGSYMKKELVDSTFDIDPSNLRQDLNKTSWIYYDEDYKDENGNTYEPVEIYGTENRKWITYNQMPKMLVDAFIAIEDERYWSHNGVDWKRTFGAVLSFATGSDNYGGSTITQQLIKNYTGDDETSIQRKVKEITRALSLSERRTKEEVLEMYLNRIHLSRSNYGVWAAAKYYFGKDISIDEETGLPIDELTLAECAALASIPKSPTKYDPVRNPEFNKERRQLVIDKMYELGWVTEEQYLEAKNQDIELNITFEESQIQGKYSYFTDALIEQIVKDLGTEYGYTRSEALGLIYSGGLQIYSTENPSIQKAMEEVFNDPNTFATVDDGVQPQSAMVVMDPYTGEVLGIVGGRGEKVGKLDLNRATMSKRQVGSSIKPLSVYAPAMDLGIIDSFTPLDDSPVYMEKMEKYWPSNSPNRYFGHISVNEAIIRSKNTTAVKLVMDMGVDYPYNFLKNKLHFTSLVEADRNIAPLGLGGFTNGITVLEMAAAYTIFPNEGNFSPARLYTKVLSNDGTILLDKRINEEERAIKESTAAVMSKHLENVVWSGTAARINLKQKVDCAGKTGTTNDNKDLYYCGYTPYYVGACWFGYDIPKSLYKFSGNPAMIAWEKVMEKIHKPIFDEVSQGNATLKKFDDEQVKSAEFCIDSGKEITSTCALDPRGIRSATGYYFVKKKPETALEEQEENVVEEEEAIEEEEAESTEEKKKEIDLGACDCHVLVEWCPESNMLANDYCPRIVPKALVREENRSFMHGDVKIEDAIYTYRDVDAITFDQIPDTPPFYKVILAEGETTGYMTYEAGAPVNGMCKLHRPDVLPETEPDEDYQNGDEISGDLSGFEVSDGGYDDTLSE